MIETFKRKHNESLTDFRARVDAEITEHHTMIATLGHLVDLELACEYQSQAEALMRRSHREDRTDEQREEERRRAEYLQRRANHKAAATPMPRDLWTPRETADTIDAWRQALLSVVSIMGDREGYGVRAEELAAFRRALDLSDEAPLVDLMYELEDAAHGLLSALGLNIEADPPSFLPWRLARTIPGPIEGNETPQQPEEAP